MSVVSFRATYPCGLKVAWRARAWGQTWDTVAESICPMHGKTCPQLPKEAKHG